MGTAQTQEHREPQNMDRPMRCVFKAHSSSRRIGVWIYEGRLGWRRSGVIVAKLLGQKMVLSW
jgi:hypothetical protein